MKDFVKLMYSMHCDIKGYVPKWISEADYKEITGKGYE